ncbi:MAG: membrane protein [Gammaproteobacteria bacterium]|nr:MAG: membrane protein [Gammaproteobacteria bacterium]
MNEAAIETTTDTGEAKTKQKALIVYVLYLAGLLFAGVPTLIGLVLAYLSKNEAPEWLQSHFRFQIRTFWISLLYFFVGALLAVVVIGYLMLLFALIWWIVRCIKGLLALSDDKPVANPTTWWF